MMKSTRNKLFRLLTGIILLMTLPGCLDIYFTTEIKANGDIVKTLVLEGDSTEITESYFPVIHNETWSREWIPLDDDKTKLVLSKTFRNDQEAAADLNPSDSLLYVRIIPALKKKFRWFFTYFEYSDKILATNPYQKLDWEDYLSEEDIELILMDEDVRENDPRYAEDRYTKAEERMENYMLRSGFEEFFQLFLAALQETPDVSLQPNQLISAKEKLYQAAVEGDNDSSEDLIQVFQEVLETEDVAQVAKNNREYMSRFDQKTTFFDQVFDDNLHFTIRMPGLLIHTNSSKIEGNSLTWSLDSFETYFMDYYMEAESRVVNNWAFLVTGLVFVLFLGLLIYQIFRRKS